MSRDKAACSSSGRSSSARNCTPSDSRVARLGGTHGSEDMPTAPRHSMAATTKESATARHPDT